MQGLQLSTVRVDSVAPPAGGPADRPTWSFDLVSAQQGGLPLTEGKP